MFVSALALVAAELGAVPTDRLVANKAAGTLSRSQDAWFHGELQPVCPLVLVALLAILPGHPAVPRLSHRTSVPSRFSRTCRCRNPTVFQLLVPVDRLADAQDVAVGVTNVHLADGPGLVLRRADDVQAVAQARGMDGVDSVDPDC